MEGKKQLEECTLSVAFAKDVDPVIKWCNRDWTVKGTPEELFKTSSFKSGDNKVELILTFNTVQLYACAPGDTTPKLYTFIAAEVGATE